MHITEIIKTEYKDLPAEFKQEFCRVVAYEESTNPSNKFKMLKKYISRDDVLKFNLSYYELLVWLVEKEFIFGVEEYLSELEEQNFFQYSWGNLPNCLQNKVKAALSEKGLNEKVANYSWTWSDLSSGVSNIIQSYLDSGEKDSDEAIRQDFRNFDIVRLAYEYKSTFFNRERVVEQISQFDYQTTSNGRIKKETKETELVKFDNPSSFITTIQESEVDERFFIPIKSNTALDRIYSTQGGIMVATNTVCIGDPGLGKTALMLDFIASIKMNNPDKKVLFISSEMNRIELTDYKKKNEKIGCLDVLYLVDYYDENPFSIFKNTLEMGWDIVLIDSLAETMSIIKEEMDSVHGKQFSMNQIESKMVDILKDHNSGNNESELPTSFICIQQVTKGGDFVGTNKLKHNTQAMLELRKDKQDATYCVFTKNRRGKPFQRLFYVLHEERGLIYKDKEFEFKTSMKDKFDVEMLKEEDFDVEMLN